MHFLSYTKYKFVSLLKMKVFWICLLLYFATMCIFLYVIPVAVQISYIELFTYKTILNTIGFILIFGIIFGILYLFKDGYEDGSELILHSKPIPRVVMVWGKIFIIILIAILISLFEVIITSFVSLKINDQNVLKAIMLGAFFAPLISCLFWSGISIIAAFLFKKTTVFLLIMGIMASLSMVNLTINLATTTPAKRTNNQNINFVSTRLFDRNGNVSNNYSLAITNNDWGAITSETKLIDNKTISQLGYTPQNLLQNSWQQAVNDSKIVISNYFNGANLLSSFYYININNYNNLRLNNDTKSTFELDPTSYYFKFQPINETLTNFLNINYQNNQIYLVAINDNVEIDQNNFTFPIPTYNAISKNYDTQEFSSLQDFYNIFFSNEIIQQAKALQTFLKSGINQYWGNNIANYYINIFSSYVSTKLNIDINNFKNNSTYSSELNKIIGSFQYKTFLLIQDYFSNPSQYQNVTQDTIDIWFGILNQTSNKSSPTQLDTTNLRLNHGSTLNCLIWSASDNNDLLTNLDNKKPNQLSGFVVSKSSPVTLLNNNQLQTLSIGTVVSVYEYVPLITLWTLGSILLIIGASSIFMRKDIY